MVAILALMLLFLQQQFDRGDLDRAVGLLLAKPPGGAWSIAQELDARAGAVRPECVPRLVSSLAGTVEVSCAAGPSGAYRFEVDLVREEVRPIGLPAIELLREVEERNGARPSGDAGAR